jgi:tRNA threonylcarbamoyladenosine biosynthesis protein TsaB
LSEDALLLGVDTCGPSGSIALGRLTGEGLTVVGEAQLAGGEYAASLVLAIADLLDGAGLSVGDLAGIVAVAGPGSFTGIRIGLAAVKAIAEAVSVPVVTVSRLALLADSAGASCAVLDAHRGQFYCGMYPEGQTPEIAREMLLTAGEINAMGGLKGRVAVCEETVAQLLEELFGEPEFHPGDEDLSPRAPGLIRVEAPSAAAALRYSLSKWQAGEFADVASLDGYYLRGADAKVSARLG